MLWFTWCCLLLWFFSLDLFFLIRWPLHIQNFHLFTDKRWLFVLYIIAAVDPRLFECTFQFILFADVGSDLLFFFFWVMLMLLLLEARNYIKGFFFFRFFVKICKVRLCKERVQTERRNKVQEKRGKDSRNGLGRSDWEKPFSFSSCASCSGPSSATLEICRWYEIFPDEWMSGTPPPVH